VKSFACAGCGVRHRVDKAPVGCPHCAHEQLLPRRWQAVLVQELVRDRNQLRALLRPVRDGDPVAFAPAAAAHPALKRPILAGKETKRLLDNGFQAWGDLYTRRQADALVAGLRAIAQMDCTGAVKDRLAFTVLGVAEMPAFLSRWDRFNLKPFEGMANHRYTQTTLAVESNPLSPVGRGTLPRRLEAATLALDWLVSSRERPPKVASTVAHRRGRRNTDWDVLVTTGSSVRQALRDASVNVVITDPPYFDDVQYGELARLFHVWLSVYDPSVVVDEQAEAVPNSVKGITAVDYRATIAACLRECRRTLTAEGRIVLTFHNKQLAAWRALAGAIADAGLHERALAAVLAEHSGDHCKRNVNAMQHDLVIECVPAEVTTRARAPSLEFRPESVAEINLAAVGLALAECVRRDDATALAATFLQNLTAMGAEKRLID
jgi:hypothetical protein